MSRFSRLVPWLVGILVVFATARVAWVCDDAYITFRTIDHLQLGYGPVWNPGERVQAYTHPLWMGLLALVSLCTRELYFTSIAVGLAFTALTVACLFRVPGARQAAPWILVLATSKAFTEFGTSGLENSMAGFLFAIITAMMTQAPVSDRRHTFVSFLLGLTPLVRPDLVLIATPPALLWVASVRDRPRILARALGAGLAPILCWTLFSLFYYGSPVANTAIAKLGHAHLLDALKQGLAYFASSLQLDPVLLPTTALGLAIGVLRARTRPAAAALSAGAVLYLAYVLFIGGDFMSGRFFTLPFLIAIVAIIAQPNESAPRPLDGPIAHRDAIPSDRTSQRRTHIAFAALLGAVAVSLTSQSSPLRTDAAFHVPNWDDAGIADERGWYYPHLGLVPILREGRDPPKPGRARQAGSGRVRMGKAIGMDGYMAGPAVHLVDAYALCDPLLARIPSDEVHGRPGHWIRPVPVGYLDTLTTGQNVLADPEVRALWGDIVLATRAPLTTPGRFSAIWRLLWRGRTAPITGVPPMDRPPKATITGQGGTPNPVAMPQLAPETLPSGSEP